MDSVERFYGNRMFRLSAAAAQAAAFLAGPRVVWETPGTRERYAGTLVELHALLDRKNLPSGPLWADGLLPILDTSSLARAMAALQMLYAGLDAVYRKTNRANLPGLLDASSQAYAPDHEAAELFAAGAAALRQIFPEGKYHPFLISEVDVPILQHLAAAQKPACVHEIAAAVNLEDEIVGTRLRYLDDAGYVRLESEGRCEAHAQRRANITDDGISRLERWQ